jgi:hypothetical protein
MKTPAKIPLYGYFSKFFIGVSKCPSELINQKSGAVCVCMASASVCPVQMAVKCLNGGV